MSLSSYLFSLSFCRVISLTLSPSIHPTMHPPTRRTSHPLTFLHLATLNNPSLSHLSPILSSLSLYLAIYQTHSHLPSIHPSIQPSNHPTIQPSTHPFLQLAIHNSFSRLCTHPSWHLSSSLSLSLSLAREPFDIQLAIHQPAYSSSCRTKLK